MGDENDDQWCQSTEEKPDEEYAPEIIYVQTDVDEES